MDYVKNGDDTRHIVDIKSGDGLVSVAIINTSTNLGIYVELTPKVAFSTATEMLWKTIKTGCRRAVSRLGSLARLVRVQLP